MAVTALVDARTGSILAGVRTEFINIYRPQITKIDLALTSILDAGKTSTGAVERYAYPESPPNVPRWDKGNEIPRGSFTYRQWSVVNHRWGKAIDWDSDDADDDQLKALVAQATSMADRLAIIPFRVVMQIIQATSSDPDLLPALPLAPDGAAMFSTTDGAAANRFGVSGGNVVGITSIATEAAVERDTFRAKLRFRSLLDTAGQRRWPNPVVDMGVVALASAADEEVLTKAWLRGPVTQAATGGAGVAAGVSPVMGWVKDVRFTSELPTGAYYFFLVGAPYQPIFKQAREAANVYFGDRSNSDRSRDQNANSFYVRERAGYGLTNCDGCLKVA